ncbi:MAG: toll/interleukin-1 receptor domain-containing protein [Bryobacteraceae bacterium]
MRVLLSFSHGDANLAAKLEDTLRHRNIQTWSSLDLAAGEQWRQRLDQESAEADGFVLLVGAGASASPDLESEWRTFLRNDWESNKPLIPVLIDSGAENKIPSFLRSRKIVATASFDEAVNQIEHLLQNPTESRIPAAYEQAKADQASRLEELKEFALALKDAASTHDGTLSVSE